MGQGGDNEIKHIALLSTLHIFVNKNQNPKSTKKASYVFNRYMCIDNAMAESADAATYITCLVHF